MRRKTGAVIAIVAVMVVLAGAAVAFALFRSANDGKIDPGGVVEMSGGAQGAVPALRTQTTLPTTATTVPTTAEPTTVLTAEELFVQRFLSEANSYTTEDSSEYRGSDLRSGYFHVVTDGGTVSNDNSLEGLEGTAKTVGEIILAAGFRYDSNQNIFYSDSQSWQRYFGFTPLYDAGAALSGMYYDTMRIKFAYADKEWMFQLWKGRYGITTGAEMGIYCRPAGGQNNLYSTADEENEVTMSFALYKGDKLYMTRGPERHWWLTGFRIFDMIDPKELTLHATFFLEDDKMADALERSIIELGFIKNVNYQRLGLTMTIVWN